MSGWIMRNLTKKETKLFKCYILGFSSGVTYLPVQWNLIPDEDIVKIYKKKVPFLKRSKEKFAEFREGFFSGYFKSIAYDGPLVKLDPALNEDIRSYLESLWLYHKVYGAAGTTD